MNASFQETNTSLKQNNDVCGSKHEAYTFNQKTYKVKN